MAFDPDESQAPRVFVAADASTVVGGYVMLRALRDPLTRWLLGGLFIGIPLVGLAWATGWVTVVFLVLLVALLCTAQWHEAGGWRQGLSTTVIVAFSVWLFVWLIAMLVALFHLGS